MSDTEPEPMDHEAWSAAQSEATVEVDGRELSVAYYEGGPAGDDGDAETLVFLHGIPTWSFLWRRIAPAFEEEYRVIVPDLVGYGNSDRRDCFDRSIRAQEGMLRGLLDTLGEERVSIAAHDIGGGVALRFAAADPDRVDQLALSNSACYDTWPVEFVNEFGLPTTVEMDDDEFEGKLDFAFGDGAYGEADPAFVAGMKEPWLREDGKRALARAAVSTNTNHTTEIEYDAIDADVLCLWGADDVMQPIDQADRLAEDLGGEVVGLEEAYHWVPEDRPAGYREALASFLTET
jgi:pimeloyl-ACP methyl ester carboxylesterase